jgi:hypothetical protein
MRRFLVLLIAPALTLSLINASAEAETVIGGGRLGESGVIVNSVEGDGVSAPPDTSALSSKESA